MVATEQDREVRRVLEKAAACRGIDLEAWEITLQAAVLAAGAKALSNLIKGIGSGRSGGQV